MLAGYIASVLRERGIECELRNQYLTGGAGELPPTDIWPEIWIADEHDRDASLELVRALTSAPDDARPAWTCPVCGEWVDGQFDTCWSCGRERAD